MTNQPPFDGKEGPMDLNEAQLKERLDTAVSDVSPDVFALVTAGTTAGRGFRRRRRIQQGLGSVAASALVVGAIAYAGIGQDLFGSNASPPADGGPTSIEQLVDATPRGMAAAVMAHIDGGKLIGVSGDHRPSDNAKEISVNLGYLIGGQAVELQAFATDDVAQWNDAETCPSDPEVVWCDDTALADGTPVLQVFMKAPSFDEPTSSDDLGAPEVFLYTAVTGLMRDGELVGVYELVRPDSGASYTVDDLPFSMETLLAIATDPAVGLSTTEAFNEQGKQIQDFDDNSDSGSGSSSGSAPDSTLEVGPPEQVEPSNGQEPGEAESSSANSGP